MSCDMCHKKTADLEPLNEGYATKEIVNICCDCRRIVNDKLWQMRKVSDGMVKALIKRFMGNYNVKD